MVLEDCNTAAIHVVLHVVVHAMQNTNVELQCTPAVSLQVQSVLTVLSVHRKCVL